MASLDFTHIQEALKPEMQKLKQIQSDENLPPNTKSLRLRATLKDLSDSDFTILEEMLMEIEIGYRMSVLAGQREKIPPLTQRVKELEKQIKKEFKQEPDLAEVLLDSIPLVKNVRTWIKSDKWKEEIDRRMRDDALFSAENRHQMIESVYKKGLSGSARHAEMYLKMSGDLGKPNEKSPAEQTFETLQNALRKS